MIRKAKVADVKQIKQLLASYAAKGLLLDRPVTKIYENLRDFFVAEENNEIIGCCALHICWENLAELRSLAVHEKSKGNGIGKALAETCLKEAKEMGFQKIFTLTYVPDFFKKLGFKTVAKEEMPHKVWADCINCVKFPDCDENAMLLEF